MGNPNINIKIQIYCQNMPVKNTNRKIEESGKKQNKSPIKNDNSLSWLDTYTSIKSGGV